MSNPYIKKDFNPIMLTNEDGFEIDEVGDWAESKYRLVGGYCEIFTQTMKSKWDKLVYIDLFSGCGYSKIRDTTKIIKASPLIATSLQNSFTDYIFCEEDPNKIRSLEKRVKNDQSTVNLNCHFVQGDCNDNIDLIISRIPQYSRKNKVLSFCFMDPYNIKISFSTIKKLSLFRIDFMILLAFGMDAKRNFTYYLKAENNRIEKLLNDKDWRMKFKDSYSQTNSDFVRFIANKFNSNMQTLGYQEPAEFQGIRSTIKNLDLYHIAFYSRSPLGNHFWNAVRKYQNAQPSLF